METKFLVFMFIMALIGVALFVVSGIYTFLFGAIFAVGLAGVERYVPRFKLV